MTPGRFANSLTLVRMNSPFLPRESLPSVCEAWGITSSFQPVIREGSDFAEP